MPPGLARALLLPQAPPSAPALAALLASGAAVGTRARALLASGAAVGARGGRPGPRELRLQPREPVAALRERAGAKARAGVDRGEVAKGRLRRCWKWPGDAVCSGPRRELVPAQQRDVGGREPQDEQPLRVGLWRGRGGVAQERNGAEHGGGRQVGGVLIHVEPEEDACVRRGLLEGRNVGGHGRRARRAVEAAEELADERAFV